MKSGLPYLVRRANMLTLGARVPPNVKFEVDDVEGDWVYAHPFDYIFCRYMTGSIADWPKLVRNIYEYVISSPINTFTAKA